MSAIVVKVLLVAAVIILVAAAIARMRGRRRVGPVRQRMPWFVPVAGGVIAVIGGLMTLASFTAENPDGALWPMRIASVLLMLGGFALLLMYRNFYVEARADEIAFRTIWGREWLIPYSDIIDYSVRTSSGRLVLTVR
ncbi:MAG: hypothetical protein JSS74_17205, partial [Actinobacteria bacterium]|nr:hypothetical protein [Actinomycetota bacterium]